MKKKNILVAGIASLTVLAVTAFLVVRRQSRKRLHRAPQLPLHNPGDQSDFPASPGGEETLG